MTSVSSSQSDIFKNISQEPIALLPLPLSGNLYLEEPHLPQRSLTNMPMLREDFVGAYDAPMQSTPSLSAVVENCSQNTEKDYYYDDSEDDSGSDETSLMSMGALSQSTKTGTVVQLRIPGIASLLKKEEPSAKDTEDAEEIPQVTATGRPQRRAGLISRKRKKNSSLAQTSSSQSQSQSYSQSLSQASMSEDYVQGTESRAPKRQRRQQSFLSTKKKATAPQRSKENVKNKANVANGNSSASYVASTSVGTTGECLEERKRAQKTDEKPISFSVVSSMTWADAIAPSTVREQRHLVSPQVLEQEVEVPPINDLQTLMEGSIKQSLKRDDTMRGWQTRDTQASKDEVCLELLLHEQQCNLLGTIVAFHLMDATLLELYQRARRMLTMQRQQLQLHMRNECGLVIARDPEIVLGFKCRPFGESFTLNIYCAKHGEKSADVFRELSLVLECDEDVDSIANVKSPLRVRSALWTESAHALSLEGVQFEVGTKLKLGSLRFQMQLASKRHIESGASCRMLCITNEAQVPRAWRALLLESLFVKANERIPRPFVLNVIQMQFATLLCERFSAWGFTRLLACWEIENISKRFFPSVFVQESQVVEFCNWFGKVLLTISYKRQVGPMWASGKIVGHVPKRQCEDLLMGRIGPGPNTGYDVGTFVVRFSESVNGAFAVAYVTSDKEAPIKHFLVKPDDINAKVHLPDFLMQQHQFTHMLCLHEGCEFGSAAPIRKSEALKDLCSRVKPIAAKGYINIQQQ